MNFLSPSEQLQIIKENVEEIIPEEELLNKLKKVSSKTLLRLGGTVTIKRTTNSSYNDKFQFK